MILITRSYGKGGVANYYNSLRKYLPDHVKYCAVHNPDAKGMIKKLISFPGLFFRYLYLLLKSKVVCVNPSLYPNAYYRDMVLILVAKLMRKKIVVFFRGWDENFEFKISKSKIQKWLFKKTYGVVDKYIVLGSVFRDKLISLGVKNTDSIYQETTVALPTEFDEVKIRNRIESASPINLLFLSRLVEGKGIDEALYIYEELKKISDKRINLMIAGDGPELVRVQEKVMHASLGDVTFLGDVRGEDKEKLLSESHILLFPSVTEGMPNTVLEAMSYGILVSSTPVGGVPDIINDDENGFLFDLDNPGSVVKRINNVIDDRKRFLDMVLKSKELSKSFSPDVVSQRLLNILSSWN